MTIKRISTAGLTQNPKFSGINKNYNKLSVGDYNGLLRYLYKDGSKSWINPMTDKELNRNSKVIISYLSHCYYNLDNGSKVNIEGYDLSYREHVLNFIDEIYLYEKGRTSTTMAMLAGPAGPAGSSSPRGSLQILLPPIKKKSSSPQAARNSPRAAQAAQGRLKSSSSRSSRSSPQAARNSPRAAQGRLKSSSSSSSSSASSKSSAKMSYSSPTIHKTAQSMSSLSVAANKLTAEKCINFVNEIKRIKKGLTADQIKTLKIKNPVTGAMIGFRSPIFQSFLHKCYNTFDNKQLKKSIRKVVSKKFLDNLKGRIDLIDKQRSDQQASDNAAKAAAKTAKENALIKAREARLLAAQKERDEMKKYIVTIEEYIQNLMKDFHKCCDELVANCKDGVLSKHIYITKVVNSIVLIIYTKYLHLRYYYDDLYINYTFDSPLPMNLIMFDDTIVDYYKDKQHDHIHKLTAAAYGRETVIFQKDDLTQNITKDLIDNILLNNSSYQQNILLNRQYIFDMFRDDSYINAAQKDKLFTNIKLVYNKVNLLNRVGTSIPFKSLPFPTTLNFPKLQFSNTSPFNYNLSNSVLPRTVFTTTTHPKLRDHAPFHDLMIEINTRLQMLPKVKEIAKEETNHPDYYNNILYTMKKLSFGNNDTGYGSDHMIRKNILYSLNAQNADYIRNIQGRHVYDIFYNSEYTGVYPIFTWIPVRTGEKIYDLAKYKLWQPFGANKNDVLNKLGSAYKNYGVAPYSKELNDAIYKVITKKHTSIDAFPIITEDEKTRLKRRVDGTIGIYLSMNIESAYKNNSIYLFHGTKGRLHTMKDRDNDIEILGFLSTSLNVYTASYYSEIWSKDVSGFIYIIETDDKKGYINLTDNLYQFILLPHSIVRILYEYQVGKLTIILCRLIMTPSTEESRYLYNSLMDIAQPARKSDSSDGAAGAAGLSGGISSMKQIQAKMKAHASHATHTQASQIIKPVKNMRKIGDMPEDIREYYGITITEKNKNEYVDISSGCYVRMVNKKVVDKMIAAKGK